MPVNTRGRLEEASGEQKRRTVSSSRPESRTCCNPPAFWPLQQQKSRFISRWNLPFLALVPCVVSVTPGLLPPCRAPT